MRTRKLTRLIAATVSVGALVFAAACGSSSTPSDSASSNESTPEAAASSTDDAAATDEAESTDRYKVTLVPGMTGHPAYQTMLCGALGKAKELGNVDIDFQGANAWDPTKQVPVVQSVLATSPDALLLVPSDSTALRAPVEQYLDEGIPVITVDTGLEDTDGLTAVVASDNVQGGAAAAEALGKAIDGKGTVAIISGVPGATTDNDRMRGFQEKMAESYPDVKILDPEYSESVIATAESQVRALMLAHPDLTGVFGINGNSATGAANAIVNADKKGEILVAGYDAEPATVEQLRAGNITILVVQDFIQEGQIAVQYAYDAISGNTADIQTPVILDNVIATTETADDPDVSKYFYMEKCEA